MMGRAEKISIYSSFTEGLAGFIRADAQNIEDKHRKSSVSHRIALFLRPFFPPSSSIDIDIDSADVTVRSGRDVSLAIFWSKKYLSRSDKKKIIEYYKRTEPSLTLAIALLPEKEWLLLYRFEDGFVEYIHIDKETFIENLLRKCTFEESDDDGQLLLSLERKRRRKATSSKDQAPDTAQ